MMRWLLCFLPLCVGGQELLLNGGFEDENVCTEYKVNCAPQAWVCTVPSFSHYIQNEALARSGGHCIELVAAQKGKPHFKSFIRTQLLCGLQKGKQYQISFWVKGDRSVLDSTGIYFSATDFLFDRRLHTTISASIYLKTFAQPPTAQSAWQIVHTHFTASGTEAYLTIGSFKKSLVSSSTKKDSGNILFYVDDVSLRPVDLHERLCPSWQQQARQILAYHDRHELQAAAMIKAFSQPVPSKSLKPTVTIKVDTFTVPDVFFSSNSFLLTEKSFAKLDSFARWLMPQNIDSVVIEGHTDAVGNEPDNQILSWRRANTVAAYLQKQAAKKYIAYGWGSTKPIATNNTAKGKKRNRRVSIFVYRTLP